MNQNFHYFHFDPMFLNFQLTLVDPLHRHDLMSLNFPRNQMTHYFQKNQMNQNYLHFPKNQMNRWNQNFLKNRYYQNYPLVQVDPSRHHGPNYHYYRSNRKNLTNQMSRGRLGHPSRQVSPSHHPVHYFQRNPMNQNYQMNQSHPWRLVNPLHHRDPMNPMNQNYPMILSYPENPRYLVFQAIPLHHHGLNYQMSRMSQMIRNLYHLNHLTPQNCCHRFH
jgi:hypothetical protein